LPRVKCENLGAGRKKCIPVICEEKKPVLEYIREKKTERDNDNNNPSPVCPRGSAKANSNQRDDTLAPTEVNETLYNMLNGKNL